VASASEGERRVLVTGGAGFTGRHLIPELKRRGYLVMEHSEAVCDLRDSRAVRSLIDSAQPDFVVHLAAISFVGHGSAAEIYDVNTIGTTNLLEALRSADLPVNKVIIASSSQVYGNCGAAPIDEASPCRPVSHYGCSKLAMEHMAANYNNRFQIVITRPFNYTGAGQPSNFLVPKIVAHHTQRKAIIELGNLDIVRDFSDVRMVIDAYCRLMELPGDSQVFNICSGVGRSLSWIIEETRRLTGHTLQIVVRPEFIRASDIPCLVGSNDRLVKAIGSLHHTDFTATLRWMIDHLR
jgi:GDP-6-deoxy-D-talose 4-dehydrogenase